MTCTKYLPLWTIDLCLYGFSSQLMLLWIRLYELDWTLDLYLLLKVSVGGSSALLSDVFQPKLYVGMDRVWFFRLYLLNSGSFETNTLLNRGKVWDNILFRKFAWLSILSYTIHSVRYFWSIHSKVIEVKIILLISLRILILFLWI